MYKSFSIKNFRCFDALELNELAQVNLITGLNNIGKTCLLEALFLQSGRYNPEIAVRLNAFRGFESFKLELGSWNGTPWDSIFPHFDNKKTVELLSVDEEGEKTKITLRVVGEYQQTARMPLLSNGDIPGLQTLGDSSSVAKVLELSYEVGGDRGTYNMLLGPSINQVYPLPPPPPFPAYIQGTKIPVALDQQAERFGKVQYQGDEEEVLQFLRIIEPRLERVTTVFSAGKPILHGVFEGKKLVPLPLMGDGVVRLTTLVLHIATAPGGVVLVDEIENGLHHSILQKVMLAVGKAAQKFGTQVFATTHSLECIVAAHRAYSESGMYDCFKMLRLERKKKNIVAVTYDEESLEAAISSDLEVR